MVVLLLVSSALARWGDDAAVVVRSADAMAKVCCCRKSLRFGDLDGRDVVGVSSSSSACASKHVLFANDGDGTRPLGLAPEFVGPTNVSAVAGVAQPARQRQAAAVDEETAAAAAAAARLLVTADLLLLIDERDHYGVLCLLCTMNSSGF